MKQVSKVDYTKLLGIVNSCLSDPGDNPSSKMIEAIDRFDRITVRVLETLENQIETLVSSKPGSTKNQRSKIRKEIRKIAQQKETCKSYLQ